MTKGTYLFGVTAAAVVLVLAGCSGPGTDRMSPEPEDTAPSFADMVADQMYTVGMAIAALMLPEATGGDGTLTYSLGLMIPDGLTFDGATRTLRGTPTTAGTYAMTYTAMDADDNKASSDAATLNFTITIQEPDDTCAGSVAVGAHSGLAADCEVMLEAKQTLMGTGGATLNWAMGTAMGQWDGVTVVNGRVTELHLNERGLAGSIAPGLGALTKLEWLNLQGNQLTGTIPVALGELTKLKRLNLHGNQLTGTIPVALANLKKLQKLSLQDNQLTGTIPVALSELTKLTHLWVNRTELTGSVPIGFGALTDLAVLNVKHTQIVGCVPEGLRSLGSGLQASTTLPFCAVTLSLEPASVDEAAGNEEITVTAAWADGTHVRVGTTTISVSVSGGTAHAGSDYVEVSAFDITIGDRAASGAAAFTLSVIDDTLDEAAETLRVSGVEATAATYSAAKLTIVDDD